MINVSLRTCNLSIDLLRLGVVLCCWRQEGFGRERRQSTRWSQSVRFSAGPGPLICALSEAKCRPEVNRPAPQWLCACLAALFPWPSPDGFAAVPAISITSITFAIGSSLTDTRGVQ